MNDEALDNVSHLTPLPNRTEINRALKNPNVEVREHLRRADQLANSRIGNDCAQSIRESVAAVEKMTRLVTGDPNANERTAIGLLNWVREPVLNEPGGSKETHAPLLGEFIGDRWNATQKPDQASARFRVHHSACLLNRLTQLLGLGRMLLEICRWAMRCFWPFQSAMRSQKTRAAVSRHRREIPLPASGLRVWRNVIRLHRRRSRRQLEAWPRSQ